MGIFLAHDVLTGTPVKELADGDLGALINRANAVQGGHIPSWTTTKEVRLQLDSTGDTLDHLTAGAVQVTVIVEYLG